MSDPSKPVTIVGTLPLLPEALARFPWWTTPVLAEYLAVLRIGIAVTFLYDLLFQYLPTLEALFGPESTGASEIWRPTPSMPVWSSLFHGLDYPPTHSLALIAWSGLTLWIGFRLLGSHIPPVDEKSQGTGFRDLLVGWLVSGILAILGDWSQVSVPGQIRPTPWLLPAAAFALSCGFLAVHFFRFGRADRWFVIAFALAMVVFGSGAMLGSNELLQQSVAAEFTGWSDRSEVLRFCFYACIVGTISLGVGFCSRVSAVLVWVLAVSFANLNPILNHGEVAVRSIVLFYLMLCPCGAAWSVDRLIMRRQGKWLGRVYVSPWPLRLLLVQLVLIYCCTGLYKVVSERWLSGEALYYVLSDLHYSRISPALLSLPPKLLQWMTWAVLVWEVTFPVWVLFPATRSAILISGVLFHLGTLTLMELGGFEWYMFVMYLPLLPWGRWLGDPGFPADQAKSAEDSTPLVVDWRRLCGCFVAWHLIYLVAANLVSILNYACPPEPGSPAQDLLKKVARVTDFWGDLTDQPQGWVMYHQIPKDSHLPFIKIRHDDSEWIIPSDQQPLDDASYVRFGRRRLANVEENLVPYLSDPTDNPADINAVWAKEIADSVAENQILIRNYVAYRVRRWRLQNPEAPTPAEAILFLRRYRTNPPGSAFYWEEPLVIPIARWNPVAPGGVPALEAYNPGTKQFDSIKN